MRNRRPAEHFQKYDNNPPTTNYWVLGQPLDNASYAYLNCQERNEATASSIVNQNKILGRNPEVIQQSVENPAIQLECFLKIGNFAPQVPLVILRDVQRLNVKIANFIIEMNRG